jgi:hypothetical protein
VTVHAARLFVLSASHADVAGYSTGRLSGGWVFVVIVTDDEHDASSLRPLVYNKIYTIGK